MQNEEGSAQLRLTSRGAKAAAFREGRLIGSPVLDQRAVESHGVGIVVGGMDVHLWVRYCEPETKEWCIYRFF
jgi:hypothetical protein